MKTLDIVIVSHNVKKLLLDCLASIYIEEEAKRDWNVMVIDNASTDGSAQEVKKKYPEVDFIESEKNLGFSKGNNLAKKSIRSQNVLFINPDTVIEKGTIQKCLEILKRDENIGAVSCRVELPDGKLDYSCHRGLPTVWNTFSYWAGFSKLFPKSKFFSGYKATYLDYAESHEIDCASGTFLLVRKKVLDKVNWWDEDYFWNGEDIELCYQIKKHGWKIWYEASVRIIHYKGSSSGLWESAGVEVPRETSLRSARSAAKVMNIFVKKHWNELGPAPLISIVWVGIWLLEKYRLTKLRLGMKYT